MATSCRYEIKNRRFDSIDKAKNFIRKVLSLRKNEAGENIFEPSRRGDLVPIAKTFAKELNEFVKSKDLNSSPIFQGEKSKMGTLGFPTEILESAGLDSTRQIMIDYKWLKENIIDNSSKHISLKEAESLVRAIHSPLAIYHTSQVVNKKAVFNGNRIEILTSLKNNNGDSVIAIIEESKNGYRVVDIFATNPEARIFRTIDNSKMLFVNKEKLLDSMKEEDTFGFGREQSSLADLTNEMSSDTNIGENIESINENDFNITNTSEVIVRDSLENVQAEIKQTQDVISNGIEIVPLPDNSAIRALEEMDSCNG